MIADRPESTEDRIAAVTGNREAAMSESVQSSIGCALVKLAAGLEAQKIDISTAPARMVTALETHGFKVINPLEPDTAEIKIFLPPDRDKTTHWFDRFERAALGERNASPLLDVMNYADEEGVVHQLRQPLAETYKIICAAVLDNAAYAKTKSTETAEDDLTNRLHTFLRTIEQLSKENRCTLGRRTDLVMSLNYVHPDVAVVEDLLGEIKLIVSDWFGGMVERIQPDTDQFDFILNHFDAGVTVFTDKNYEEVRYQLGFKLTKKGINIKHENVKSKIEAVLSSLPSLTLPFMPEHPLANTIRHIATLFDLKFSVVNKNHSLKAVEPKITSVIEQLKTYRSFEEIEKKGISTFTRALTAVQYLKNELKEMVYLHEAALLYEREIKLLINDILPEINSYELVEKDNYSELKETLEAKLALLLPLKTAYEDTLKEKSFIENCFALWKEYDEEFGFGEWGALKEQAKIKTQLLALPLSYIFMSDACVTKLIQSSSREDQQAVLDLSVYQINLLILHATIAQSPGEWSNVFYGFFATVVGFIKRLESQGERGVATKHGSYPDALIQQLEFLLQCHRADREVELVEIILPEKLYFPCRQLQLSEKVLDHIIASNDGAFKNMAAQSFFSNFSENTQQVFIRKMMMKLREKMPDNVRDYLASLRLDHEFIKTLLKQLTDPNDFEIFIQLLRSMPVDQCTQYCLEKKTLITSVDNLCSVLSVLALNDKQEFIVSMDHLILNENDLLMIAPKIVKMSDRIAYIKRHENKLATDSIFEKCFDCLGIKCFENVATYFHTFINYIKSSNDVLKIAKRFTAARARLLVNPNEKSTQEYNEDYFWFINRTIHHITTVHDLMELVTGFILPLPISAMGVSLERRIADLEFLASDFKELKSALDICDQLAFTDFDVNARVNLIVSNAHHVQTKSELKMVLESVEQNKRLIPFLSVLAVRQGQTSRFVFNLSQDKLREFILHLKLDFEEFIMLVDLMNVAEHDNQFQNIVCSDDLIKEVVFYNLHHIKTISGLTRLLEKLRDNQILEVLFHALHACSDLTKPDLSHILCERVLIPYLKLINHLSQAEQLYVMVADDQKFYFLAELFSASHYLEGRFAFIDHALRVLPDSLWLDFYSDHYSYPKAYQQPFLDYLERTHPQPEKFFSLNEKALNLVREELSYYQRKQPVLKISPATDDKSVMRALNSDTFTPMVSQVIHHMAPHLLLQLIEFFTYVITQIKRMIEARNPQKQATPAGTMGLFSQKQSEVIALPDSKGKAEKLYSNKPEQRSSVIPVY